MQVQPQDALPKIMLARYYGSRLGRFLSADPVAAIAKSTNMPQRWNGFSYAANNALRLFDPDGRDEYSFTIVWGNNTQPNAEALTNVMRSTSEVLAQGGHTASYTVDSPDVQWERPESPGAVTDVDVLHTAQALGSPTLDPETHSGVIVVGETVVDQTSKGDKEVAGLTDPEFAASAVDESSSPNTAGHEVAHQFGVEGGEKHNTGCTDNVMCREGNSTDLTPEQRKEVANGMGTTNEERSQ